LATGLSLFGTTHEIFPATRLFQEKPIIEIFEKEHAHRCTFRDMTGAQIAYIPRIYW
jgi:hypothetical protein